MGKTNENRKGGSTLFEDQIEELTPERESTTLHYGEFEDESEAWDLNTGKRSRPPSNQSRLPRWKSDHLRHSFPPSSVWKRKPKGLSEEVLIIIIVVSMGIISLALTLLLTR